LTLSVRDRQDSLPYAPHVVAPRRKVACPVRVKIDKTHSEQNETAIPPKLSVKADVAERRIALTIAIGANIKST
jgi:hypothetical protein